MAKMLCRHCQAKPVNRSRGLCWSCFYQPAVRDLYPITSKYARRSVGSYKMKGRPPSQPTDAFPGSDKMIVVLSGRAERGEDLFSPLDKYAR